MRCWKKSVLLVAGLSVIAAMSAPGASATQPREGVREYLDGEEHCPPLNDVDPCRLHLDGEITSTFHIFGIESTESSCHVEAEGRVNEAWGGAGDSIELTDGNHNETNCTTTMPPCSGSLPWMFDSEETAPGVLEVHFDVCLDPAEIGTCQGELVATLTEESVGGIEVQHVSTADTRIGSSSFCEATTNVEAEQSLHPLLHVRGL